MEPDKTRRNVLKSAAVSTISLGGITSVSASSDEVSLQEEYEAWNEAHRTFTEKYGREEADRIVDLFEKPVEKYESGAWSAKKAIERAWKEIISDPVTKQSGKDISSHLEFTETLDAQVREPSDSPDPVSSSSASTSEFELELNNSHEDGSSGISGSYSTSSRTHDDDGEARTRGYCGTVVGGTSEYVVRLLTDARGESGTYQANVDYKARGTTTSTVGNASTELFILLRNMSNDTIVKERIEDLGWSSGDEKTGSAQFELSDDALGHQFGVELRASASAIVEYTYSDYWGRDSRARRRRVDIDRLAIQEI